MTTRATLIVMGMLVAFGAAAWFPYRFAYQAPWIEAANELPAAREAARKAGIAESLAELAPTPLAPEDDALPAFKNAVVLLRAAKLDSWHMSEILAANDGRSRQALSRLLDEQRPLIEAVLAVAERPSIRFERDWTQNPADMLFPEYAYLRTSAKLLAADAQTRAWKGDHKGALESVRAISVLATHPDSDGNLIGLLVRIAIESIGWRSMERVAAAAPNEASLIALRDLADQQPELIDLLRSTRMEATYCCAMVDYLDKIVTTDDNSELSPATLRRPGIPSQLRNDAYQARAFQFWTKALTKLKGVEDPQEFAKIGAEVESPFIRSADPTMTWLQTMSPILAQVGNAATRRLAQLRCSKAHLRALLYLRRHGQPPATLAEAGVAALDPFDKASLRYRVEGRGFRIWSVGVNKVDDQGQAGAKEGTDDVSAVYPPR